MEKVAVYTRVSTYHEEQLTSMKNQQEYYIKYCDEQGYGLYKIYADEGLTGTGVKRKEFLDMLIHAGLDVKRDVESGEISFKLSTREPKFELIITKDVSRFSRNVNSIEILRKLREKKVYVIFENMNFSTKDDDWEFRLSLFLTFSQQESIDRSKKVAFAYKQRAETGIYHMSRPLFGYNPSEDGGYEIVEEEAKLVREVFNKCVNENMGGKAISKELNDRGLKTRNGKNWRADGIKRMLQNEKYKGQVIVNRYTSSGVTSSNRKIQRPKDEWIIYDNAIPAIVSKELFDQAQKMIEQRTQVSKNGNKKGLRQTKSIFHKKVKCGKCDADFIRVSTPKVRRGEKVTEYNYYCRNRRMFGTCDMKGINHNTLVKAVNLIAKELPNELSINLEEEKKAVENALEILEERKKNLKNEKDYINEEIRNKQEQIDKLLNVFLSENVSETVISATQRKVGQLEEEKMNLEKSLLGFTIESIDDEIQKINNRFQDIFKLYKKKDYTFDEVLELITTIRISEEAECRVLEFIISVPSIEMYTVLYTRDKNEMIEGTRVIGEDEYVEEMVRMEEMHKNIRKTDIKDISFLHKMVIEISK